jgi:hypothetical protein
MIFKSFYISPSNKFEVSWALDQEVFIKLSSSFFFNHSD